MGYAYAKMSPIKAGQPTIFLFAVLILKPTLSHTLFFSFTPSS